MTGLFWTIMTASSPIEPDQQQDSLQAHFHPQVPFDEIEQVFHLKRAQPLLQAFTALFHGGFDGVLVRLLVLRELAADTDGTAYTRGDINVKLAYLVPDSLETVLGRLRAHNLLAWDAQQGVYRVTPMARNVLAALEGLMKMGQPDDEAEVGFLMSQVAGSQAMGQITAEQLQHLLGRLVDLTEEFRDAIASGSEFRLRKAQAKWNTACDWVEKGSQIIQAITTDPEADSATHRAAQAIGRAQSTLLNMQGMFSRALNQIERQRVHLGQSGLSTTDVMRWLLRHDNLASLAENALEQPANPMFITPAEMIDVAETELLQDRGRNLFSNVLPEGEDAPLTIAEAAPAMLELEAWLDAITALGTPSSAKERAPVPVQRTLLPASFGVASYRASLLPLIGDTTAATAGGASAKIANVPMEFSPFDEMVEIDDPHVAALSRATLTPNQESNDE
jgi:hypothetical protein